MTFHQECSIVRMLLLRITSTPTRMEKVDELSEDVIKRN